VIQVETIPAFASVWTDRLPEDSRDQADEILIDAARSGADLRDLNALGAEVYAKSRPGPAGNDDPEQRFEDRSVRLETTFEGAGVVSGDLTPECTAAVTAVLDALSAPMGADDTRSREQSTSPAATYKQPGTYFHALLTVMQPSSHRSPAR
jgi:hypothetical protein